MKILNMAGIFLLTFSYITPAYAGDKITLKPGQVQLINNLQQQGYIVIDPEFNRVQIDPVLWAQMKYNLKEDLAATLAVYVSNRRNSTAYWVEIADMYSGKKLAKWSQAWGMKTY
jgi:hypothetical protein